ncbi:MAG: hypothetical protein KDG58_19965 [Anaerolineae bacterium]|nr:hypothetical protein [Anaerolineae bacterium]
MYRIVVDRLIDPLVAAQQPFAWKGNVVFPAHTAAKITPQTSTASKLFVLRHVLSFHNEPLLLQV